MKTINDNANSCPTFLVQNEIRTAVYSKRQKLSRAFDIIKVNVNGRAAVTANRWQQLMQVVKPSKSNAHIELLGKVLDTNGDDCICKIFCLPLLIVLSLPFSAFFFFFLMQNWRQPRKL